MSDIKFPKGQQVVLTYIKQDNTSYIITKDKFDRYTLYLVENNKSTKVKTADSPLEFKEVYPWERIRLMNIVKVKAIINVIITIIFFINLH